MAEIREQKIGCNVLTLLTKYFLWSNLCKLYFWLVWCLYFAGYHV